LARRKAQKESDLAEDEPIEEDDFDYSMFTDSSDYEDSEYEEDLDTGGDSVYEEETPADWIEE